MMTSKGRIDLKIWPSEAKYLWESDFDVEKALAPPKNVENDEKPKKKSEKIFEKIFPASKNQKLQIVRNAFCQSFVPIGAMFEG